jgi:hypothetical protein
MRVWASWAIVLVVASAYPLAILAGGEPRFPSREDCVHPATENGDIEAVLAYVDSEHQAAPIRARALHVGFQGAETVRDACGRVEVVIPGILTLEVGRQFAEEARSVGFDVTLEQAG